jgi:hypothetical protein
MVSIPPDISIKQKQVDADEENDQAEPKPVLCGHGHSQCHGTRGYYRERR